MVEYFTIKMNINFIIGVNFSVIACILYNNITTLKD